ncbi:MAG: nickel-dependent hydrogenase large subunit [Candidatus Thermoplasmatota archaeon]
MNKDFILGVEHVTRVEGHGNIILNAKNGKIEHIQWQVSEAPRFFEVMVRGQYYKELQTITSRICGICSIGHSLASLKATEDAFGVSITEQTKLLRLLAINAENMQSHILHIGYLVAPDLYNAGSVIPLLKTEAKQTVLRIIKLHRLANEMSDLICGRTIHPLRLTVGGFTETPRETELLNLRSRLTEAEDEVIELAEEINKVSYKLPDFKRETEYIALSSDENYALYDGVITSTDTGKHPDYRNYHKIINEYVVPHSTAKYAKHVRESYMVGALARFNINADKLHRSALEISRIFNLKPVCYNPFMNTIAQLVEFMHNIKDSINVIDTLLDNGIKKEKNIKPRLKAGRGVGVVEVPRGMLIHDYTFNSKGYCTNANCIIPTNQNHANIQKDMEMLAPMIIEKPTNEIELTLEMLVRAYDPCISCSTHYLHVELKE